jgi:hypothetical protein
MKKLLFSLVLVFATCFAYAQIPPQAFNYSAVARNSVGVPISNSTIGIQISILKTTAIGAVQYSENHFINTDAFGLFNLIVGSGAIQQGSMGAINWSSDNFYMKVGMDANGGTNFLTMGTTQLLSVPYALHAKTADSVTNGAGAVYIQAGNNVSISGTGTSADPYIVNSTASNNLLAPTVTTNSATNITPNFAVFNANVNANSLSTAVSFEYGTTTEYGLIISNLVNNLPNVTGNVNTLVSSSNFTNPFQSNVLLPSTTYHYRVKAQNAVNISYGEDMTFTTPATGAPEFNPYQALQGEQVSGNTYKFTSFIFANGLSTSSYIEYGTTLSFGNVLLNTPSSFSGPGITSVSSSTVTLNSGVTYYVRCVATNSAGTVYSTTQTISL